jgi:hypothetical protein
MSSLAPIHPGAANVRGLQKEPERTCPFHRFTTFGTPKGANEKSFCGTDSGGTARNATRGTLPVALNLVIDLNVSLHPSHRKMAEIKPEKVAFVPLGGPHPLGIYRNRITHIQRNSHSLLQILYFSCKRLTS